jgi:hypothetical protein
MKPTKMLTIKNNASCNDTVKRHAFYRKFIGKLILFKVLAMLLFMTVSGSAQAQCTNFTQAQNWTSRTWCGSGDGGCTSPGRQREYAIYDGKVWTPNYSSTNASLNSSWNRGYGSTTFWGYAAECEVAPPPPNHYRIEHDGQGTTGVDETVTLKACANANCTSLSTQTTSITLSPTVWADGNNIDITNGSSNVTFSRSAAGTITFSKSNNSSATPDAPLRCFNGSTENCEMIFTTPPPNPGICLDTASGIYGELKLEIDNGVTMNGNSVSDGDTSNNSITPTGGLADPTINLPSLGSVSYGTDDITLNNNSTFSPGTYRHIEVDEDATITMTAGDYYIDYFDVKKDVTINLSGQVTIHVGKFDLDKDVKMNASGNAEDLTVKWYGGGTEDNKFHLHDDVEFTGIIYSSGASVPDEGVKLHKNVIFKGGIFTDSRIKIAKDIQFTYGTAEHDAIACPAELDHYRIEHDGQGIIGVNETVTLKACANANCTSLSTQTASITLSPAVWADGNNIDITNGSNNVTLSRNTLGTITFGKTTASPNVPLRCFNGSTENCDFTFTRGIVAEYQFDETQYADVENEVIDSIGGFNGRAKNAQPVAGKVCNAVDLSATGVSDYLILDAEILDTKTDFTVALWAKTSKTSNQALVSGAGSSSNNEAIMWFTSATQFTPHIKSRLNNVTTGSIAGDSWHHLVWTRQGAETCLYRDAALQGCTTSATAALNIQSLILGQEQDNVGGGFESTQAFDGLIDELLVFKMAISASEITDIYTNQNAGNGWDGTARACPAELDHYRIEHDTSGSVCAVESVTLKACANENCSALFDQPTSISLLPSGWTSGDNITFTGETTATLSHITADTITFAQSSASPAAPLKCFTGDNETNCEMTFSTNSYPQVKTIEISSAINNWLQISEVVALGTGADANTDLALTATASASATNYHSNSCNTNTANCVLDGVKQSDFHGIYHDNPANGVLTITLNTASHISSLEVFGREDSYSYRDVYNIRLFDEQGVLLEEILNANANNNNHSTGAIALTSSVCDTGPDHYRIEHDTSGSVCAVESVTLKACANENCSALFDQPTSISLLPSGWTSGDNITFTGETTATLSHITADTITFAQSSASPAAPLKCFTGDNETNCEMTFSTNSYPQVKTIEISSASNSHLQISEVVALGTGADANTDLALTATASASATNYWSNSCNTNTANCVLDGVKPAGFPAIYHDNPANGVLTITLNTASHISSLEVFGREGCCSDRDVYNIRLFDEQGVLLEEILNANANNNNHSTGAIALTGSVCPVEIIAGRATLHNTNTTAEFSDVCFDQPFAETPLVFTLPTNDESAPNVIRIKNVTTTGFEIAQVQSQGTNSGSVPATIDFVAIVPGQYNLAGGARMDVVSFNTNTFQGKRFPEDQRGYDDVNFSSSFSSAPAIIAAIQTMNNESGTPPGAASMPFLATAIKNVGTTDFDFALERAESLSGTLTHSEQVGYIAIDAGKTGQFMPGINYQSILTPDEITHSCSTYAISISPGGLPLVVGSQNRRDGGDGSWLQRCSLSNTSVGVKIDEDMDQDAERNHTANNAGILALGGTFTNQTCNTEPPPSVDHYRIEHDGQGLTCQAEPVIIKACANSDCTELHDEPTSLTLLPSGWAGSDTISFTGSTSTTLSHTTAGMINLGIGVAIPGAELKCFNGASETCGINFVTAGFEFFGQNVGDSLGDQLAENNFNHVNLRAVKDDGSAACVALLNDGIKNIDLAVDCIDPASCKTNLTHNGNPLAGTTGLNFTGGTAPLNGLNYADAGRLQLSASAVIDGVTITSGNALVDVYPASLALNVLPANLSHTDNSDTDTYVAGEAFTLSITAFGTAGNNALPNYQPGALKLQVTRNLPAALNAVDGILTYGTSGSLLSALSPDFTPALLTFVEGVYSYPAHYNEVGRISINVKDDDYLGNMVPSNSELTLGDFVPAYFDVSLQQAPQLANTCGATFSYIGEEIEFNAGSEAIIKVTGKNALDQTTRNYSSLLWTYAPNLVDVIGNVSYLDNSGYPGTATVVSHGQSTISDNSNYDGWGLLKVDGFRFQYNKVDTDNSAFDLVSPFAASVDMVFSADFLSDDGVCFKDNYADADCNAFNISNITGANLRFGRLVLDSTYGPETEPLMVNIKAEYYDANRWRLNTADSCTAVNFTEDAGQLNLSNAIGLLDSLIDPVKATGLGAGFLSAGISNDDNDFLISAPGQGHTGELKLSLVPAASGIVWPAHLNYDWNGDGNIDDNDFPSAMINFGLYRGHDKIIQWRELSL